MKLPPRTSRPTHSSYPNSLHPSLPAHVLRAGPIKVKQTPTKPGLVIHRKPNNRGYSSFADERREVDALDAVEKSSGLSSSPRSEGSVGGGGGAEKKGKEEVELADLIEASKGKGIRAPRTGLAQSLDYDVVPPHPPVVALPNAPVSPINVRSNLSKPTDGSAKPTSMLARTRAIVSSFGLGRTPELTGSLETDGGALEGRTSLEDVEPLIAITSPLSIPSETQGDWERIPSFKSGNAGILDDDHWVGIEDDNDETLVFWDDIDEDKTVVEESKVKGQTLTYARGLKGGK